MANDIPVNNIVLIQQLEEEIRQLKERWIVANYFEIADQIALREGRIFQLRYAR